MNSFCRRPAFSLMLLCALLVVPLLVTGCSSGEESGAPTEGSPEVVGQDAATSGLVLAKAGVNPPKDGTFTCWMIGRGFQAGDKVLVNGTTEIWTTFGSSKLLTFAGGAELLEGRSSLSLVIFRPGTDLRSNTVDARIPEATP